MPDAIAHYVDELARLERIGERCAGLVADVRQRSEALCRWQAGVADGSPIEELEAALTEFCAGEPPSWSEVRGALRDWVQATDEVLAAWRALPTDERAGLNSPPVQRAGAGDL